MLKALPGVERVRAKASNQCIDVLYDAAKQDISVITGHLAAAGYQIRAL